MALTEQQEALLLCGVGKQVILEDNDVEASRSPQNMVFHYCDPIGIRASYAGCLHTMDAVFDDRGHLRPDCQLAINAGTCNAMRLRKDELRANKALYYVPYFRLQEVRAEQLAAMPPTGRFGGPKRADRKFVPTEVKLITEPKSEPKAKVEAPNEIQTNIMEQVLKKKVQDDNSSST